MRNIFSKRLSVEVFLDNLLCSQGFKERAQVRPEITEQAARALDLALQFVEPAFVLDRFPVGPAGENKVKVGKIELNMGDNACLLEKAEEAVIYVTTIGGKLEKAVNELSRRGNWELGYWLDCAGVLALNAVDREVWTLVESLAEQEGYGVGMSLSPGSLKGWPVEEQRGLCSLLDTNRVGVSVNASYLLVPYKSASNLIGMGPGYNSARVLPACDYCVSEGNCWMKHAQGGA